MATPRRFETSSEMFMGELLVWTVEIFEPTPRPFAYPDGVDAINPAPRPGTFVAGQGWVAPEAPAPAKRRPSRTEWVRAFFAGHRMTHLCRRQLGIVTAFIKDVMGTYTRAGRVVPRRVARALARYIDGPAFERLWDTGTLGRIRYEWERDRARQNAMVLGL
jgi:hypothetical protein